MSSLWHGTVPWQQREQRGPAPGILSWYTGRGCSDTPSHQRAGLHLDGLALLQEHVQFHCPVLIQGPIVLVALKAERMTAYARLHHYNILPRTGTLRLAELLHLADLKKI